MYRGKPKRKKKKYVSIQSNFQKLVSKEYEKRKEKHGYFLYKSKEYEKLRNIIIKNNKLYFNSSFKVHCNLRNCHENIYTSKKIICKKHACLNISHEHLRLYDHTDEVSYHDNTEYCNVVCYRCGMHYYSCKCFYETNITIRLLKKYRKKTFMLCLFRKKNKLYKYKDICKYILKLTDEEDRKTLLKSKDTIEQYFHKVKITFMTCLFKSKYNLYYVKDICKIIIDMALK